ncbi:uncharacterized protein BDV14DRAFT_169348 [Aspergillus stella-maris]|uniref:uncharacterized protein n=1 Tax=Aspergillus stella-maris TaxID=1810926 RepID=UPI003CCCD1EF
MAGRQKSHVFRVTGLFTGQSDKDLEASLLETLNNSLTPKEQSQTQVDIIVLPSCYKPDTRPRRESRFSRFDSTRNRQESGSGSKV